ncbi:NB-ARC domain-containing protein [Aliterella atlantica]|uniref:NB-ARC domain-containing protein n=1 Tax=Aliterella atlantica CENA595 TaxID=1618023 RepID=A0A0D8ZVX8_9CYAN|nr:NB-ARC domain-containing protein [Aliterella atlantica]KJH72928.1 NB-ARC domain-containing protein [Aliterella atlantica CENA595]
MDAEAALAWVDNLVLTKTGERLSALQLTILQQVWQGRKYLEIAQYYGYTEGHIKDIGSQLWQLLSKELGEKITKINCCSAIERYLHSGDRQITPSIQHKSNNFIGRSEAIAHLNSLVARGSKAIVIQGEGGIGKTTLAQAYLHQHFEVVLELLMAKETQNITSAERVVEEWLKQDLQQESGVEFGVNLARLKRQLQTRTIGILIDNLEPALARQGQLISQHRSYVELLRVLTDSRVQAVVLITSRDRLSEPSIHIEHYRLPSLTQDAWQQFFSSRGVSVEPLTVQQMHIAYGGNAKAMGILCGAIQADFAGDAKSFWQENHQDLLAPTDLKNLVASQVNRLHSIDPKAYRLFCRLGCYRYQDVAKIPIQGVIALLWDVPISEQRQVIASLRNRSLVECDRGKYYLHPVICTEAIARLRTSAEWSVANHQAADFWTNSIQTIETIQDGLQALEAYYHYVAVADFDLAARVILKSRNNQWRQYLPLGSTLYRLGLLQPVLAAITQIIDKITGDRYRSEIYNILGDLYWIGGKIHLAIDCQEKAIALSTQALNSLDLDSQHPIYCLKMIEIDSLLSIGLYKIDLWELVAAANLFKQVIALAQNTPHHRWAEKATVCLALINSYLGFTQEAYLLVEPIYQAILTEEVPQYTGRFAYFIQLLGQTYFNMSELEKANQMYHRALYFSQQSNYTQVQAKTLNALAELDRQHNSLTVAIERHLAAIDLLISIGAKCDLAEAYFQLSLTYKKMNRQDESIINFNRAIQLFANIKAPKQVEKISNLKCIS